MVWAVICDDTMKYGGAELYIYGKLRAAVCKQRLVLLTGYTLGVERALTETRRSRAQV
jgi:hypothetical protein